MTHLVLIGMMAAGKTTVGRIVADRLGWPLVDSDEVIERTTGRTVRDIFRSDGEEAFRVLEAAALRDALGTAEPTVIAAAGGVVLRPENRAALRSADARVVWLRADPAVLRNRVGSRAHRPLLDEDPAGTLQRMFDEREPLYREVADDVVTVDHLGIDEVVDEVLGAIAP